jgi:two-component system, OmpR family, response regulator
MQKILIVDDDADLRETMKVILAKNYIIREAGSRKEAAGAVDSYKPDLIILDVMMESVDAGFELAREIKGSGKHSSVKILMVTSVDKEFKFDFKGAAGDSEWLPVDDYLTKPMDPKSLLAKVKKLIG